LPIDGESGERSFTGIAIAPGGSGVPESIEVFFLGEVKASRGGSGVLLGAGMEKTLLGGTPFVGEGDVRGAAGEGDGGAVEGAIPMGGGRGVDVGGGIAKEDALVPFTGIGGGGMVAGTGEEADDGITTGGGSGVPFDLGMANAEVGACEAG